MEVSGHIVERMQDERKGTQGFRGAQRYFWIKRQKMWHHPSLTPRTVCRTVLKFVFVFHKKSYITRLEGRCSTDLLTNILQAFISSGNPKEFAQKWWNVHGSSKTVPSPFALSRVGREMWGCLYLVTVTSALTASPLGENHRITDWFGLEGALKII